MRSKHHKPVYYRYDGWWANVVVCNCGSVSLYNDNHPVNPCVDCGTKKERKEHSARWVDTGRWYSPKTWGTGFWLFAEKDNQP